MTKFFMIVLPNLFFGNMAWAACNPCICGPGGGLPIPPECHKSAGVIVDERAHGRSVNLINKEGVLEFTKSVLSQNLSDQVEFCSNRKATVVYSFHGAKAELIAVKCK